MKVSTTSTCVAPIGTVPEVLRRHRPDVKLRSAASTGPIVASVPVGSAPASLNFAVKVALSFCDANPPRKPHRVNGIPAWPVRSMV